MAERSTSAPALTVQVVLYRHGTSTVARLLDSVDRCVAHARDRHLIGSSSVLIGDSSPEPALAPDEVTALTEDRHRESLHSVAYHHFGRNRGSAGGNNDLFARSLSDLVLIINPDCYASPDLVSEMCRALAEPSAAIVDARQVPLEHPKDFDRRTGETSWASGACMMIRRDLIGRIGGFDEESFFMYCDDVDLSWRARLNGYRVLYRPSACVFHDKRLDPHGQIVAGEAEVYYSAEASLMMAWKWSNPRLLQSTCRALRDSGYEPHRRAVEAFEHRRAENRLPTPLDPDGRISQFTGGNYAAHRFSYAG